MSRSTEIYVIVSETLILLFCQSVGESSWQTGISSMAVRFVGQKQECRWFVAKIPYSSFTKGTVWFLFCSNSSVYIHFCTHTCTAVAFLYTHLCANFLRVSPLQKSSIFDQLKQFEFVGGGGGRERMKCSKIMKQRNQHLAGLGRGLHTKKGKKVFAFQARF